MDQDKKKLYDEFFSSVYYGELESVQKFLDDGINPNIWRDINYRPALCIACDKKHFKVAELLLAAGAEPNVLDEAFPQSKTPLDITCKNGHLEFTKTLLSAGADVNKGQSLSIACGTHNYVIVKLFLKIPDIDVNVRSDGAKTALMYASEYGKSDIVQLLLNKGADPNILDKDGNSALTLVCKRTKRRLGIAKMLLKAGANPSHIDNEGYSAIVIASMHIIHHKNDIISELLKAGADPNHITVTRYNQIYTTLYSAIKRVNEDMLKMLLEAGADPNIIDVHGNSPLTVALGYQGKPNLNIVRLLLSAGADPNHRFHG